MKTPTICKCENKNADQFRSNCEAYSLHIYFLNLKFPASSHLLCLYSSVCVGPVRRPHCWFSHDEAYVFVPLRQHILYFVEIYQFNGWKVRRIFKKQYTYYINLSIFILNSLVHCSQKVFHCLVCQETAVKCDFVGSRYGCLVKRHL